MRPSHGVGHDSEIELTAQEYDASNSRIFMICTALRVEAEILQTLVPKNTAVTCLETPTTVQKIATQLQSRCGKTL